MEIQDHEIEKNRDTLSEDGTSVNDADTKETHPPEVPPSR